MSPGWFVESRVSDELVEQRILETWVRCGPRSVVTGWAGLRLHGGGWFDGLARDGRTPFPVQVAANGERVRAMPGLFLVRTTVPDDEVVVRHGIRCAQPERALFDEICCLDDLVRRVVAADMAFAGRLTSLRRMRRYRAARYWYRDVRRLDEVLALADEGSRSGPETSFRLIWECEAGWGRPLTNRRVLDRDGAFVATPDLLDPVRRVVGEFAGADHRDIDRHRSDIAREAALRAVGLEYVEVVARDLAHPDMVVTRMQQAAGRVRLDEPPGFGWCPPAVDLDALLDRRGIE